MSKNHILQIGAAAMSLFMAMAPVGTIAGVDYGQNYSPSHYNPPPSTEVMVSIVDNAYQPQHITIQPGTKVTWKNNGSHPHTVTFNNSQVNSGILQPGQSFSHTFHNQGTFSYYCQLHPTMTGSVTVTGQGGNYPPGNHPPHHPGNLTGTVTQPGHGGGQIIIHNITPVKTSGTADGTFQNGWQWIFDISVPSHESNLAMRFSNWWSNMGHVMPTANNVRFYSPQSSNATNQNNAIVITAANTYSQPMILTGTLGNAPQGMRRIQITVETRIPTGTPTGTYSANYGIRTQ